MQLIVPGHILHFFESVHEVASPSNEEQEHSELKDGCSSIAATPWTELEKQFIDSKTMEMEEYFQEILIPLMRLLDRFLKNNKFISFC